MTTEMETRQRKLGGRDAAPTMVASSRFDEKEVEDDQGKWEKGYLAGPGVGGRRGLPPKQRIAGWVSLAQRPRGLGSKLTERRKAS